MASAQFEKYLTLLRQVPMSQHVDPEQMRAALDRTGGRFPEGVVGTAVIAGGVPAEWIDAPDGVEDRVVLYLHGGGYVAGSIDSHRNLTGHLAAAMGCRILALDYRLAPEHPHPAAVTDAVAAYRWLLDQGIAPEHVVIAGDSAGGGLTVALLLRARDEGLAMPAAAVPISPMVDLEATGESMTTRAELDPMVSRDMALEIVQLFLGDGDRRDPYAAPLHGELAALPPLLIQVGDAEVLLDDSVRLADKARTAGVDVTLEVWPEMVHVFQGSAGFVPEADEAIAHIANYCRPKLGLG
jgi:monoterpene epsilon-lactone hydrolase